MHINISKRILGDSASVSCLKIRWPPPKEPSSNHLWITQFLTSKFKCPKILKHTHMDIRKKNLLQLKRSAFFPNFPKHHSWSRFFWKCSSGFQPPEARLANFRGCLFGVYTLEDYGRLTWNLQITHLERKMIFQTSMIIFHVNLQGCRNSQKIAGPDSGFWVVATQICFIVTPIFAEMIPNVTSIFFKGVGWPPTRGLLTIWFPLRVGWPVIGLDPDDNDLPRRRPSNDCPSWVCWAWLWEQGSFRCFKMDHPDRICRMRLQRPCPRANMRHLKWW